PVSRGSRERVIRRRPVGILLAMHFPSAATPDEFAAIRRDERALLPIVEHARANARITQPVRSDATRFADGSLPVYALGEERVLKLYPPCYPEDARVERAALELLDGRLPIPTPRLEAYGEVGGWRYIVMSRLRGRSLAAAWP